MGAAMRALLTRHLYLMSVAGSLAAFLTGRALGWPLELIVVACSLLVLTLGALLERVIPFDARWRLPHGDLRTDTVSAVTLIGLVDPAIKAVLPALAVALLPARGVQPFFPTDAPFLSQVLLAIVWIEFAKYWSHRAHHAMTALWWLHALHHSSQRLYWLNNFRFHPINHLLNALVSMLPLWLVGVPVEVLLGAAAVTQPILMLQHANLDLRSGCLNGIFSTNEVHRWHHSTRPGEANANFGSAFVLWDRVFGTYHYSSRANAPAEVGLFGDGGGYPSKQSYSRQLASMFTPNCCRA
jgi:sterol desaturase/sphingolipid hydroxylase (fatty acid hydroxylase superfamily)